VAINFPNAPTVGQLYPQPAAAGVPVWQWSGSAWVSVGNVNQPGTGLPALLGIKVYTANDNYVPTGGMAACLIECCGGGAGGNGTANGAAGWTVNAGGGGSGGYSRKYLTAAQVGAGLPVTIGAGGAGGAAGAVGLAGGDTSVGTLCIAKGAPALAGGTNVAVPGQGAPIGTGDLCAHGNPGMGGASNNQSYGGANPGAGGASVFGGAGWSSYIVGVGTAATQFGAGGSGAYTSSATNYAGGNGSPGVAVVWEFAGISQPATASSVGMIEFWPTSYYPSGNRLKCNGATYSRTTYNNLFGSLVFSGAATFTNGSANVGMTAHGRAISDPIKLYTTGTLPTNFTAGTPGLITAGTVYYVKSIVDANTMTLSASVGGAAISAGSAGSGTHTWVSAPWGDGDGSTNFTVPEMRGEFPRFWDDSRGIDINRAMGIDQLDAFQGHVHPYGYNPSVGLGSGSYPYGGQTTTGSPSSDGTNGTPRTAAETRPRNVTVMATIRYA
jgi:hypothetical protein